MAAGIEIAQHYAAEALRLHFSGMVDPKIRVAMDALNWMKTVWPGKYISISDLCQRGPNSIRVQGARKSAVSILEDHRWLQKTDSGMKIGDNYRRDVWQIMEG